MKQSPFFSFIIPVYNRPNEIEELLDSMLGLNYSKPFEIVIVEDGSTDTSEAIISNYTSQLLISYYFKNNTGPGDSRNYGMKKAKGAYFLILDSDVILPPNYLLEVESSLDDQYVDCFGGIDNAHDSFTDLQKAINSVMTSFLTTGGIRGRGEQLGKFQPRSFNMGLSKKAFEASKGFGKIHPGEDPDLSMRLWDLGFETSLFNKVTVFHKRRISWNKFLIQVTKFGKCRPILNSWHKGSSKITYWFPTLFCFGTLVACILALFSFFWPLILVGAYVLLLFFETLFVYKSFKIAVMSVWAMCIQFYGYGKGFFISFVKVSLLKMVPEKAFPKLFF
ncbi:glycosyltransferase [Aquimarina agarilytica]|uniref:glycosyltransferase n=1 Tax=Aquimarina agarilytica TaxID=1087449 RepID=UPI0002899E45|nr:glycosyltransferase [Aquimarina agarilytica]